MRKPCRTAQSCYAFNRRIISRFPRTLCIRHRPVMAPRHRVLLLKECIARTVVGSLQGRHYSEPSFPTEAGPRYKWEDYECSNCHVGWPTEPFVQLTISLIAYLRGSSLCVQSQRFLAPRANPQIPPAPCGGGLRSGTNSIGHCARAERPTGIVIRKMEFRPRANGSALPYVQTFDLPDNRYLVSGI